MPLTLELRLADIPEAEALLRSLHQALTEARAIAHPAPEWWTRAYYAERLGVPLKTLQNHPELWPPFADGPTAAQPIRREDGEHWLSLTPAEMRAEFRRRITGKLRMAK
jgi:hypothetical protein